jgi:hypothetical protein
MVAVSFTRLVLPAAAVWDRLVGSTTMVRGACTTNESTTSNGLSTAPVAVTRIVSTKVPTPTVDKSRVQRSLSVPVPLVAARFSQEELPCVALH